jgi:hypothetical protein
MSLYKAMYWVHDDPYNPNLCRAVAARVSPFKTIGAAIAAVERRGLGYVYPTDSPNHKPCWNNNELPALERKYNVEV